MWNRPGVGRVGGMVNADAAQSRFGPPCEVLAAIPAAAADAAVKWVWG